MYMGNTKKFHQVENHVLKANDIDKAGKEGKSQLMKSP